MNLPPIFARRSHFTWTARILPSWDSVITRRFKPVSQRGNRAAGESNVRQSDAACSRRFAGMHGTLDLGELNLGGPGKIIGCLKVQPELGRGIKITSQAQSGVGGDAAPAVDDLGHAGGRHA